MKKPTREEITQHADKKVIEILRQYYSNAVQFQGCPYRTDEDFRNAEEYSVCMSTFMAGASYGIDVIDTLKKTFYEKKNS